MGVMLGKWIIILIMHLRSVYSLSNAAASLLLKFFTLIFGIIGHVSSPCRAIAQALPSSLYKMQLFSENVKQFYRYVVCPKCESVYPIEECTERNKSKKCSFIPFPNHPHSRMRQSCNVILLKTVELSSGRKLLYPHITYCYLSIKNSLQSLLLKPSFIADCEKWRSRSIQPNALQDIYDGKIWNEFCVYDGRSFLANPLSFVFTINLDWFRPFKRSQYSIGAIYMTVMNLPRNMRNKLENILLVGILPGPSEPTNISSFIKPLVNELEDFWHGIELSVYGTSSKKPVRCALLCACCDLPAGRKLCGFLSYNAHKGCSRCLKLFPGSVGEQDYSGFDRDSWLRRTVDQHRKVSLDIKACKTKATIATIESTSGYRYTELLRLPYFNPTRMLVIDPMHNLFLGSGKHNTKGYLDWARLNY